MQDSRWCSLLLLLMTWACGGNGDPNPIPDPDDGVPAGEPVSVTIGPAGGTLATDDGGFTLTVPAGALGEPTVITVHPMVSTAPRSFGTAYRVEPATLSLLAPATLELAADEATLGGLPPGFIGIGARRADGSWYGLAGTDADVATRQAVRRGVAASRDGRVVSVTRVSGQGEWVEFVLIAQWVPDPLPPIVVDRGASSIIRILACLREEERSSVPGPAGQDALPALPQCQPSIREGTWSVEGTLGGSASLGFVAAGTPTSTAEFLAPNTVPTPNPVTVSVSLFWRARGLTAPPLRIPVAIRSGLLLGTATGTVASFVPSVGNLYSYEARIAWFPDRTNSDPLHGIEAYTATGTVIITPLNRCISQLRPDTVRVSNVGTLTIFRNDSTWTGDGDARPESGFHYYDTCAEAESILELSFLPFLMSDGVQPLPVRGQLRMPAGEFLNGSFSYEPE